MFVRQFQMWRRIGQIVSLSRARGRRMTNLFVRPTSAGAEDERAIDPIGFVVGQRPFVAVRDVECFIFEGERGCWLLHWGEDLSLESDESSSEENSFVCLGNARSIVVQARRVTSNRILRHDIRHLLGPMFAKISFSSATNGRSIVRHSSSILAGGDGGNVEEERRDGERRPGWRTEDDSLSTGETSLARLEHNSSTLRRRISSDVSVVHGETNENRVER